MHKESLEASDLFRLDYFSCLRSEYAKNDCRICIDLCPEEAMVFDRKRLVLDGDRCTGCCACMGSCPTQALQSSMFDVDAFVASFIQNGETILSCRHNLPCLAALSSEDFATIAMGAEGNIDCDLAHCRDCEVNRKGQVLAAIEDALQEAETFAMHCGRTFLFGRELPNEKMGNEGKSDTDTKSIDESRRALLKRLAMLDRSKEKRATFTPSVQEQKSPPSRRELLKERMRLQADSLKEGEQGVQFGFVVGKTIDKMACTNCQECATFCPTGALSIMQDNTGIIFQLGKCIACGICDLVCQPHAIQSNPSFDPITFAFDRMQILVKHELEVCEECKVAFPYKGGEKVCDRCKDFKDSFSHLFVMAKDLE